MKNISIIGKFLSIMGLFGVFAIGVASYAAYQIKATDTAYSNLLDRETIAALYSARANRALQGARAAIGDLLIARTDEGNASASQEFQIQHDNVIKYMDLAISALPSYQDAPSLKADSMALLDNLCSNTIALAKKSTTTSDIAASEEVFLKECQPGFALLAPRFTQMVDSISDTSSKNSDNLSVSSNTTAVLTLVGVIGGLLVVLAIGFFAIRSWLVMPIRGLAEAMGTLAGGDLSANVAGTERRDEVGTMAKAVQVFKDNGLRSLQLEQEAATVRNMSEAERARTAEADQRRASEMAQATSGLGEGLQHLSSGDLTFQLNEPFAAAFEGLRSDFNNTVERLRETLSSVSQATGSIDSGSRELSQSANDLSKRTEQQAAALEETAAALDQITTNVANSSKRAEEARSVAIEANQSARQSGEVVSNAVDAMQRIEQSSTQISNIIGVIDEIAFQTNLLALNAGVEAARAGEAGKGFAVVAQEVRELAQRSAQAAKEIKGLIRNSATEVESGVKLVTATGEALKIIEGQVISINTQLDAIATSSREQSIGLAEVNTAVNQMDQVTQQNAAMVEEATAASVSLADESDKLRQLISQFQLGRSAPSTTSMKSRTTSHTPTPIHAGQKPVSSPARRMVGQVAKAFGLNTAAKVESWEEF
ncbi:MULTISPECIES: methyl-accepting chemotaxis protein [unclassified Rhizobium]|uniref:methyl-accepting chemotaxis protein n=2 Tax=unclassified Rhizobium TaxID=2613769 RepID=UPI001ADC5384|nr:MULTISPECIES: methyl-accepting chemotaxis protein [unclassified Rhizobium]MBO9096861.1 HAMP domain-containing protein [Rhizobium sp. L58/93]MBO9167104.1 HAMP domain-containing protein [Rhizobium sp. L245/93]QXZ88225.1 HAMP domain-containing protein [Rhizobium sp. K1/93]QXZ94196.1 HAMP domain-containing protein [Rhizobium sp. K15/93]